MSEQIEYNSILTEREFTATDKFKCAPKASVLCDASGKKLGSVSNGGLFNLFGEQVAPFIKEETRERNGKSVRVAEYASDAARYMLIGDDLYAADGGEMFLGRIARTKRNFVHISVLSVLTAILIAAITVIALIGMPQTGGGTGDNGNNVVPVIEVGDTNGSWENQGAIAVFENGLRPGSSGSYAFVLNNPVDAEILYSFYIEPQYNGTVAADFPIKFRLRMNNILLESSKWLSVKELKFDNLILLGGSSHSFILEWEWPFESGNDENDTLIGADGGNISMVLHLTAQAR